MIRKFSVLYVGQIELDNIGKDGTPADLRRYPNERIVEAYRSMVDVARVMDDEGYYCLWTAEHHFQREGYEVLPNLILVGTYLAAVTRRLKFGCAFNILPMWHPIRLAEDYAVADILTNGRVVMGIGRGYHTREVESFGAPLLDAPANLELFEEQFELLWKALHEESFAHRGKHYTVPPAVPYRGYELRDVTLVPRPIHRPVEIWQPIASGKTIDFLAKHDLKGMVTLNGARITDQVFHAYRDACARHGRTKRLGEDLCLGLGFYMAGSREEAIRKVEPAHDERYKWFAPFGFVRYADEQGRPWGTPGAPARVPTIRDGVAQQAWMVGPPADCIALIREYEARYPGLEQLMLHWPEGVPPREFIHQLRWFARDVMPAFVDR
ncbi:MAG TPA: LLM class flavin-dependent oxidoreductase [Methylomirabilota bacterium]|jgi:alkanesulfonate monooxygenase SsuD/methylene tetrahydromethanopterin reductase-like flavin-dependent oxidoreductase (luciferase family)|nr:LLM class flavin-dependent oxidoreductase [Methylomirabilota bacterium]